MKAIQLLVVIITTYLLIGISTPTVVFGQLRDTLSFENYAPDDLVEYEEYQEGLVAFKANGEFVMGADNFIEHLIQAEGNYGSALSQLSDLDGDGVAELLIGADQSSLKQIGTGNAWIAFPDNTGKIKYFKKINDNTNGFSGVLNEKDLFGNATATIEDVNNDGFPDVAIGAPMSNNGGNSMNQGAVWLVYLQENGKVNSSKKLGFSNGTFLSLSDNDDFGSAIIPISDIDNDGNDDLVVGAKGSDAGQGAIWVLFLDENENIKSFVKSDATTSPLENAIEPRDNFGSAMANIGDLDGDGVDEVAIGVIGDEYEGSQITDIGAIWIAYFNNAGEIKEIKKIGWQEEGGNIEGLKSGDLFGFSIANIGDLDGNGTNDLVVGAPGDDDGGTNYGAFWVLFLKSDGTLSHYKKTSDLGRFKGILNPGDGFGSAIANLGDLDENGSNDIIVGAKFSDELHRNAGKSIILYLNSTGDIINHLEIGKKVIGAVSKTKEIEFSNSNPKYVSFYMGSQYPEMVSLKAFDKDDKLIYQDQKLINSNFDTFFEVPNTGRTLKKIEMETTSAGYSAIDDIIISNDNIKPDISIQQSQFHDINSSEFDAMAQVSDNDIIDFVTIFYRGASGTSFKNKLTQMANNFFSSSIESSEFDEIGLEYFFEAVDISGNQKISDTVTTYLNYLSPSTLKIPNLNFGGKSSDYRMISIPIDLVNKNIESIFNKLGKYGKKKWRVFWYNGNEYMENKDGFSTIEIGKGYWFNAFDEEEIDIGEGTSAQHNQKNPFVYQLKKGWNQIGNPYNFNISWPDVLEHNGNPPDVMNLQFFSGSGYIERDVMRRFEGAFVFSETDFPLQVPAMKNTSIQSGRIGEKSMPNTNALDHSTSWEVSLKLEANQGIDALGTFGMHESASMSKDHLDLVTIPRFINYSEVNFHHPEYFAHQFSKDIIPMADHHIWEFSVESNQLSDRAEISWNNKYFGRNDLQLYLLDLHTFKAIDMRQTKKYSFDFPGVREFKVIFGSKEFVANETRASKIVFDAPYPNPTSSQAMFSFRIPDSDSLTNVSLSIYNSLGEKVETLVNEVLESGNHTFSWDFEGKSKQDLSSGFYMAKLSASGSVGNIDLFQKIIITK